MVQKEVSKKTRLYGLVAILSAIVLISMVYAFGSSPTLIPTVSNTSPPSQSNINQIIQNPAVSGMKTFSSVEELKNYLVNNAQQRSSFSNGLGGTFGSTGVPPMSTAVPSAIEGSTDYSTTNVQVAGVDEADTVKTDGKYIYTISSSQNSGFYYYYGYSSQANNNVYIINADPQNAKVVSKITLDNTTTPDGLFISQDSSKLVILSSKYQAYPVATSEVMAMPYPYYSDVSTSINVYDISNKANPILTRNFTVSGSYFNSRMIGDYVYAVTSQSAFVYDDVVTVPAIYANGKAYGASPTTIYYSEMNQSSYYSFTSFYGINVLDDQQQPTNMTVLMSGASTMYVSQNNIYVTYPTWANDSKVTSIYRVRIDGLQLIFEAEGSVPGYTINQYAMDEYNGNLRIATNLQQYAIRGDVIGTQQSLQTNNVYVLDQNLTVVGKLEGLAQGENLHAVRFMGDRCYLVTFVNTDPLFVIDLSQPQNPLVLGELNIPGYSDYLHPYGRMHLIGVGKEAVAAEQGNFAWYQGLKLALFDVGDVNNPKQLSNYVIGDRGTDSAVLTDPKAFLFNGTKNLLVIPVNLAVVSEANKQQGSSAYGDFVWQGVYVFSLTDNGSFELRGAITHLDPALLNSQGQIANPSNYYSTQNEWITRSLYIGNTLYTISNSEVKLNSLTDLSQIAEVKLN
jgi:inhibitor of cysteine peptidase